MGQALDQKVGASFQNVKGYVDLLPPPSALFTSCIRAIRSAEQTLGRGHEAELKELSVSSTSFLVSISPTLKAIFYAAAANLHPEELKALNPLTHRSLLGLFSAAEITTILATTHLFRHIKKRLDETEFAGIQKKMLPHMEIGGIIGETINHIGYGNGMLLGAVRYLAHALFALADLKSFQELRRKLEKQDKLFDLKEEEKRWGCNHLQVASGLLTSFGFGLIPSTGICVNADSVADQYDELTAEKMLCWRVAVTLSQTFHETGSAPQVSKDSELYLPEEEAEVLKKKIWTVLRDGTTLDWLTKRKEDIPENIRKALDISLKGEPKTVEDESLQGLEENSQ